jgi:hypothetical protein
MDHFVFMHNPPSGAFEWPQGPSLPKDPSTLLGILSLSKDGREAPCRNRPAELTAEAHNKDLPVVVGAF